MPTQLPEVLAEKTEELLRNTCEFVEKMLVDKPVGVKAALNAAVNTRMFMEVFREKVAVKAAVYVPELIDNLAKTALSGKEGNITASRLLLEVAGVLRSGAKTNINLQNINVTPDELSRLRQNLGKGVVIDVG